MRIEAAVTSISWIPSEAVTGLTKAGFTSGAMHYDDPPPGYLENLAELHKAGRFRFANHLAAWAEVEDGRVVDAGYAPISRPGLSSRTGGWSMRATRAAATSPPRG
jgi:hypothetical protein